MTTTHSRAKSLTLTAVAATMQAADLVTPVAACCRTCRWWRHEVGDGDGTCLQVTNGSGKWYLTSGNGGAQLHTQADFACFEWQAKE